MPGKFEIEEGKYGTEPRSGDKSDCAERSDTFSGNSTCSAILYIFQRDDGDKTKYSYSLLTRIFWGVIVLFAVGGFCALTGYNFYRLAKEPISTSITLTRERNLSFPAVTICSLSIFNISALESVSKTLSVTNQIQSLFRQVQIDSNIAGCQSVARETVDDIGFDISFGEIENRTRYDINKLLLQCTFEGTKCSANDFEPIATVGGVCYTFNGPSTTSPLTTQGTGARQGLRLQLSPDEQLFTLGSDNGFRVLIHNRDEIPVPQSSGIYVPLDRTVYIGMKQVNSNDMTKFSSGHTCREQDDVKNDLSFPPYTSYSPSLCESECFYKYVADECKCKEPFLYTPISDKYSQLGVCVLSDLCCEVQAFDEVEESCDCPPKCETVDRATTISYSTNDFDIPDGVGVNIFYESLIVETRETTDSYTVWGLISDIGGNTGLFLGFTLLTVVEFLMLLVGLIKDWFFGGCKKTAK